MRYIFSENVDKFDLKGKKYKLFEWLQVDTNNDSIESEFRKCVDLKKKSYNINMFYEELLNSLNRSLNTIDNREFSIDDARIMYGPWLYHFVSYNYYVYSLLFYIYNQHKNASIVCSKVSDFNIIDTLDHKKKIRLGSYNGHIIKLISECLGIKLVFTKEKQNECANYINNKGFVLRKIISIIEKIVNKRSEVILKNSYIKKSDRIKIFVRSIGKISTISNRPLAIKLTTKNYNIRDKIKLDIDSNNDFMLLMKDIISNEIPSVFVESFFELKKQVSKVYTNKVPRVILSANAWYHDEPFKLWAIMSRRKGSKLIGYQHGGVYFTYKNNFYLNHESDIVEKYLSWGDEKCEIKNVKSFCSQKYIKQNKARKDYDLIMVSNSYSQYHHFLEIFQTPYFEKVKEKIVFFKLLDKRLAVKHRGTRVDYGWNEFCKYQEVFSNIKISSANKDCINEMAKSRIVVFDSVHATSLLEAVMMKIPFIILANGYKNEVQFNSIKIFKKMKKYNLLFEDAAKCSYFINNNIDKIDKWWFSKEVQSISKEFLFTYANKCNSFHKEFIKEMADV